MTEEWRSPDAPWWAKLRRASIHIADARKAVEAFELVPPWSITAEASGSNELAYRFHVHRAVPADLVTIVSDAVHNLRTALDTFVYELARHHCGSLTQAQERATTFQACESPEKFDEFYTRGQSRGLYGPQELAALRCVQPFAFAEEAAQVGAQVDDHTAEDYRHDSLRRLNALSNIDKHRRLPELGWVSTLHYWPGPADGSTYQWRSIRPTIDHYEDGMIIGYLRLVNGTTPPSADAHHDVKLVLLDDVEPRLPVIESLEGWHRSLRDWVLPRMILVAEGNNPPIMIVHEPPSASAAS